MPTLIPVLWTPEAAERPLIPIRQDYSSVIALGGRLGGRRLGAGPSRYCLALQAVFPILSDGLVNLSIHLGYPGMKLRLTLGIRGHGRRQRGNLD